MTQQRIVILGGGYAGLTAASRLRQSHPEAAITLVDAKAAFIERVRLHQAAVGQPLQPRGYAEFLARLEGTFLQGTVTRLEPDASTVVVEAAAGTRTALRYDFLLYALGSSIDVSGTPGAAEHALRLDSLESVGRIASQVTNGPETKVLVVGGGLTGLEMAAELAQTLPLAEVTLATGSPLRAEAVPGGFSARALAYLRASLARHQVSLVEGARVKALRPGVAEFSDGQQRPFSVCIWTSGFAVPEVARAAGVHVNARGQIVTDPALRSVSHPNLIAIGDAAEVHTQDSGACRMGCATGLAMATAGARTVAALLDGKAPKAFRFVYLFRNVSLGRKDGLVQFVDGHDVPRDVIWTGARAATWKEYICRGTLATIGFTASENPPSVPPLRMVPQLVRGLSQYA